MGISALKGDEEMATKTKTSDGSLVYRIKVTLKGTKPPIWRRIEVLDHITLAKLHMILQIVMGWTNSHLHQFIIGKTYYGEPDPEFGAKTVNEKKFKLSQLPLKEKSKFYYEYDFGDSWEHELLVEKIQPATAGQKTAVCLKGSRACPPEDIGGVWGYAEFLEAIHDPEHPEHDDMLEWVGDDFDPEAFDLDEVNHYLGKLR
jgi:hypothetical protein